MVPSWASTGLGNPWGICESGDYLYVTNEGYYAITQIQISNQSVVPNWVSTGLSTPYGICESGDYLYVNN